MEKRKIIFGTYDTAVHGWTLTGWKLGAAEQKTQYIEKPNGDGSWDLSTAATDGGLRYKDRVLAATFECSEGTRMERETTIREMINSLDGMKVRIRLPDDDAHYLYGRLHVVREYNDLVHAAVTVTAICDPWKYADAETVVEVTATTAEQLVTLRNAGKRAVVPRLTVTGGTVSLKYYTATETRTDGDIQPWPDLLLLPGAEREHVLRYSGSGTLVIRYREAVLE
jgi:hypothetical protein